MKIITTKDYSQFKLHKKNRKINYKKVQKLAEAMKKNNLLRFFPIIVDSTNFVLDGQHRLEAAKLAKVTLYYIISDGIYDMDNVAETNNFQSHWRQDDYVNYYAKENKQPYLRILELAKKYKIGITGITNLSGNHKIIDEIKSGSFRFEDEKEVTDLLHHAREIGIDSAFDYWNSRPFLRALKHTLGIPKYNKMRMIQRIHSHRTMLIKCHEAEEYIKLLEEIYNTGAIEPVRFL